MSTAGTFADGAYSLLCNINDTLRSRGFGPECGQTDERVIAMANELDRLRAAMGAGADEEYPMTEEWLRSEGFTTAPNKAYVRIASKDNAVAVRLATGEVEIYDNESMEMCRIHGVTRGRMRSLCLGIGIPLPAAPSERSGE